MSSRRIAFFGATGDCAGYCLAHTLRAGYDCIALARTPAKLTDSMKQKGVDAATLDQHLTIIPGNAKDLEAVKQTLQLNGQSVDTIVSGIGGTPTLQWSFWQPVTLTDPTIVQDFGHTLLRALAELQPARKPTFINVSTTGISPPGTPRDVPLLFVPLYHWFLHVPHVDKRLMETALRENVRLPDAQRGVQNYVNVKPSLLMDGKSVGLDSVRAGVDEKPAVGYTIRRTDVGLFMFERLVKDGVPEQWVNKGVSITY